MTRDRPFRILAATAVAAVTLAGCGYGPVDPVESAGANADGVAERVGKDITRWQFKAHTPMAFARLALTTELGTDYLEVLRASGDGWDDNGVLVVRISSPIRDDDDPEPAETRDAVTRCYRYTVTRFDDAKPRRVYPCPDLPALTVPAPPPPPQLPTGSHDRAKAALAKLTPAQRKDPNAITAAVQRSIVGARGQHLYTASLGTAFGVAVRAGQDCLLVRVDGAKIAVWSPPSVYLQPGEAGCTAELAASGHTPDPH